MTQIFVSHSQYDTEIRASFDTVFARTGIKSVCMEFEQIYPPAWEKIKNQIRTSDTIFLLLGPNVRSSIHTQNWIAFEVGLACAFGKEVWVFEEDGSYIEFPIPYLTDYMIYNLKDKTHFNYVRDIIEGYGKPLYILSLDDHRTQRGIPKGTSITCGYDNCGANYLLHTKVSSFYCPSCRQQLQISNCSGCAFET